MKLWILSTRAPQILWSESLVFCFVMQNFQQIEVLRKKIQQTSDRSTQMLSLREGRIAQSPGLNKKTWTLYFYWDGLALDLFLHYATQCTFSSKNVQKIKFLRYYHSNKKFYFTNFIFYLLLQYFFLESWINIFFP